MNEVHDYKPSTFAVVVSWISVVGGTSVVTVVLGEDLKQKVDR